MKRELMSKHRLTSEDSLLYSYRTADVSLTLHEEGLEIESRENGVRFHEGCRLLCKLSEEVSFVELPVNRQSDTFLICRDLSFFTDRLNEGLNTTSYQLFVENPSENDTERLLLTNKMLLKSDPILRKGLVRRGFVTILRRQPVEIGKDELPETEEENTKDLDTGYVNVDAEETPSETVAEESDYWEVILCSFLNQNGIWFISLTNDRRLNSQIQFCQAEHVAIRKEKLFLKLRIGKKPMTFSRLLFGFRSKLKEERVFYEFDTKEIRADEENIRIEAELDLSEIPLRSMYWDVLGVFTDKTNGREYMVRTAVLYRESFWLTYLYKKKISRPDEYALYPYTTGSRKLCFCYRKRTREDGLAFHGKELLAMFLYFLSWPYWRKQRIYLVYEKFCVMAQDNGYYFFKYCMDHADEMLQRTRMFYVITRDSADRKKLEPYQNRIVDFLSLKHMIFMQASRILITTDTKYQLYVQQMRGSFLMRKLRRKEVVFLQHGVTAMKKVDFYYGRGKRGACSMFIVTSDYEKQIVLDNFHYDEEDVVNTGFARWDVLEDKSEGSRDILIMPTWRAWLENCTDEEFLKSSYYRNYMELLNAEEFHRILEKNDLTVSFYLHTKFREFIGDFKTGSDRIRLIVFGEKPANELIMTCRALITDYSSVSWDVYYLKKPTIFFQFDRSQYLEAHGSYMDLDHELFGECTFTVPQLLEALNRCIDRDFELDEKNAARQKEFFLYQDDLNSKRIFDAIMKKWPVA